MWKLVMLFGGLAVAGYVLSRKTGVLQTPWASLIPPQKVDALRIPVAGGRVRTVCPSGYEMEDCNHCCPGKPCTKQGCAASCVLAGTNAAWRAANCK